jgi:outer membrane protein assembly factor BamB
MKKSLILSCMVILSIILIRCSQYSTDKNYWPGFRGINCSGIASSEQDPPVLFNPEKNVLWKVALPDGHSSPCIWSNYIFLTGVDTANKILKMFCISRTNGKIRWEKDKKVEKFEEFNVYSSPATATPATDGETVYFYFGSWGLICYDYNGELKWEMPIPPEESSHGMGTSPIVCGDLVILNCLGLYYDPRILAVNKYDGNLAWKYSVPNKNEYWADSYATPVIYNDQVIINTSNEIAGYSLISGEQIWNFIKACPDAVCTPVIGNDILYTNGFQTFGNPQMLDQFRDFTKLLAEFDQNGDSRIDKKETESFQFQMYPEKKEVGRIIPFNLWFEGLDDNKDNYIDERDWKMMLEWMESLVNQQGVKAIKLGGTGDITSTNSVWDYPEQASHVSSPLYYKGRVYNIRDGGIISCFNAEYGKLIYKEKLGAAGAYFASPIVVNDKIYIASRNGIVTVIETGDSLKILAQNDLEENITATPAIIENKVYIRTSRHLYAFGE